MTRKQPTPDPEAAITIGDLPAILHLPRERLIDEMRDLREIVMVGDAELRRTALDGLFDRSFLLGARSVPQDSADLNAAIEAGRKAGAQAGLRAGYQRGIQDGTAKAQAAAQAATPQAAVYSFVRDESGVPTAIVEERGETVVTKTLERDERGHVISISITETTSTPTA